MRCWAQSVGEVSMRAILEYAEMKVSQAFN